MTAISLQCERDGTVRLAPLAILAQVWWPSLTTARQWPAEAQAQADAYLGEGQYAPGWVQNYYPGAQHGFGTRADLEDDRARFAKEDSFKQTVAWFRKYLV